MVALREAAEEDEVEDAPEVPGLERRGLALLLEEPPALARLGEVAATDAILYELF